MIVGLGMSICFASSQEPKKDDPHTVIVWLAVVVPQNGRPEHELGEYATFEAAKAATDKWEEANKNNKAEATTLVTQREVKVRKCPLRPVPRLRFRNSLLRVESRVAEPIMVRRLSLCRFTSKRKASG